MKEAAPFETASVGKSRAGALRPIGVPATVAFNVFVRPDCRDPSPRLTTGFRLSIGQRTITPKFNVFVGGSELCPFGPDPGCQCFRIVCAAHDHIEVKERPNIA